MCSLRSKPRSIFTEPLSFPDSSTPVNLSGEEEIPWVGSTTIRKVSWNRGGLEQDLDPCGTRLHWAAETLFGRAPRPKVMCDPQWTMSIAACTVPFDGSVTRVDLTRRKELTLEVQAVSWNAMAGRL
jgi:hypothetical protein